MADAVKHTPGPWEASERGDYSDDGIVILGDDRRVAVVNDDDDARLIAAAPDLLEALRQLMGWVEGWDPNFIHDEEWPETRHHIKAAIAKASGAA